MKSPRAFSASQILRYLVDGLDELLKRHHRPWRVKVVAQVAPNLQLRIRQPCHQRELRLQLAYRVLSRKIMCGVRTAAHYIHIRDHMLVCHGATQVLPTFEISAKSPMVDVSQRGVGVKVSFFRKNGKKTKKLHMFQLARVKRRFPDKKRTPCPSHATCGACVSTSKDKTNRYSLYLPRHNPLPQRTREIVFQFGTKEAHRSPFFVSFMQLSRRFFLFQLFGSCDILHIPPSSIT